MMVAEIKREQAQYPGQAMGKQGGAMCWYLTGTDQIIRGQVHRDPDWEDRKREACGGLKFLGRSEYGPGGDCLPALYRLVVRNPELKSHIERAEANKQRKAFERANRDQIRAEKRAKERMHEATVIATALRMAQQEQEAEGTDAQPMKRGPGRPPKSEV